MDVSILIIMRNITAKAKTSELSEMDAISDPVDGFFQIVHILLDFFGLWQIRNGSTQ